MRVLILANGDSPTAELLAEQRSAADWFVCCDGAIDAALRCGQVPEAVIGDMDSAPAELPAGCDRIELTEQETTDLEKALYTAIERGATEAVILGAGGRRWDQFLANLAAFAKYADRLSIEAGDEHGWLRLLPPREEHSFDLPVGTKTTLLPLPEATGVTLRGVRWPLAEATLRLGGRDDTSNEVTEPPLRVWYDAGCLGLYRVATGA